jgi:hypothetical protein
LLFYPYFSGSRDHPSQNLSMLRTTRPENSFPFST